MNKAWLAVFATLSLPAAAAQQTATLLVEGMTCAACPITVKKALGKVPGVSGTEFDYEKRLATVNYDDTRTSAEALMQATRDAGYPSTLFKGSK